MVLVFGWMDPTDYCYSPLSTVKAGGENLGFSGFASGLRPSRFYTFPLEEVFVCPSPPPCRKIGVWYYYQFFATTLLKQIILSQPRHGSVDPIIAENSRDLLAITFHIICCEGFKLLH